jgi:hypothetical protein
MYLAIPISLQLLGYMYRCICKCIFTDSHITYTHSPRFSNIYNIVDNLPLAWNFTYMLMAYMNALFASNAYLQFHERVAH